MRHPLRMTCVTMSWAELRYTGFDKWEEKLDDQITQQDYLAAGAILQNLGHGPSVVFTVLGTQDYPLTDGVLDVLFAEADDWIDELVDRIPGRDIFTLRDQANWAGWHARS